MPKASERIRKLESQQPELTRMCPNGQCERVAACHGELCKDMANLAESARKVCQDCRLGQWDSWNQVGDWDSESSGDTE